MLYREIQSVGEVFIEREYEGTPQEIAELINRTNKMPKIEFPKIPKIDFPKIEFTMPEVDISKIADKLNERIEKTTRSTEVNF